MSSDLIVGAIQDEISKRRADIAKQQQIIEKLEETLSLLSSKDPFSDSIAIPHTNKPKRGRPKTKTTASINQVANHSESTLSVDNSAELSTTKVRKKRVMSDDAKKRLSESMKKRWAKKQDKQEYSTDI